MGERVSAVTGQIRQAFGRIKEAWDNLSPLRKRIILIVVVALVAVAVILTIVLRTVSGRYEVLYSGMQQEESVRALAVLNEVGINGRINDKGELEVPGSSVNQAMAQLATQGIPATTLGYSIFEQAGGLTTTDFEKQQYQINQMQNRLQDIIRTYEGVENAYVTINMENSSNRVWNQENTRSSASVKVEMKPGTALTTAQVSGIRFLVGPSAGIDPEDVSVIDSSGTVLAAAGEDYNASLATGSEFLQRQGFEEEVENRLKTKTADILSLPYPDPADFVIAVTAVLDYDQMITESLEYSPLDDTEHGVAEHEEIQAVMGTGQYAEGVVGETDNTDIPVYADLDGDGELDAVNYYMSTDYLVSYVKSQVEKDGAKLSEASIAVLVRDNLSNDTRQTLRELIASGTNVPVDNITIQGMAGAIDQGGAEDDSRGPWGIDWIYIYIALAVLVALIIILIIILVLRNKSKKKKLALAEAEAEAELQEQERIQQEIEERKRQLKDAAIGDQKESAISEEVREFARNNPEITANLLRNWLKEE